MGKAGWGQAVREIAASEMHVCAGSTAADSGERRYNAVVASA